jgi:hypothetical protein
LYTVTVFEPVSISIGALFEGEVLCANVVAVLCDWVVEYSTLEDLLAIIVVVMWGAVLLSGTPELPVTKHADGRVALTYVVTADGLAPHDT